MLKRCLVLLICLVLLVGVLPFGANAQSEEDRVEQEIQRIYYKVLYATGRSSLHGFCGLMASYQLYYLGVNNVPLVYDGKDQYNAYENMEVTSGGHRVKTYSADTYSLREALLAASNGGTKNVYNILVGFQWTHTDAGQYYGHACVINAIIDGVVYFSEGFPTPFNYEPGRPSVCTIDEFANYYDPWTSFEGLVVFGQKDYTDFCTEYTCNAFLEAQMDTQTWSVPNSAEATPIRTVRSGERLEAVALYENPEKELYYQVDDSGNICYVKAQDVVARWMRYDDIQLQGADYPEILNDGKDFDLAGRISSSRNKIDTVQVRITDSMNREMCSGELTKDGNYATLSSWYLNSQLNFDVLPQGFYQLHVTAQVKNHYVRDNQIVALTEQVSLLQTDFSVGQSIAATSTDNMRPVARAVKSGWQFEEGTWRYYESGKARTGWLCYKGVDYYLLEDGAIATGWQTINGKDRFFTNTGAMRTGWLTTDGGTFYMLSNGVAAVGERTIDGVSYCFNDGGALITE